MTMKVNSVTKNIVYNFIKTIMSLIFPVITFAYASRILLVEGIGKISFAKTIVQYFSLFASLGISIYGIREGAKVRDNRKKLSKFVHEILFINTISTVTAYIIFFFTLYFVSKFQEYRLLLLINSITIIFTTLGVEWFYGAIENYKYIALRSGCFQILSLILMFLLVKGPSDYLVYAAIIVFSNVGSNIFNFIHLRKYIDCRYIGNYNIKQHMKPVFIFFAAALSGNIYLLLDTSMLGFLADDAAVGLYTAANKMTKIIVSVITSVSIVLLPRMSYYVEKNNKEEYQKMIDRAFHIIIMIALPIMVIMLYLSGDILMLFSGKSFIEADTTSKILAFIIIIIPLSTIISNQIFIPLGKEKYQLVTTLTGAILNIVSNFILIPIFADRGAAAGTVIAESGVFFASLILGLKSYNFIKVLSSFRNYFISLGIMVIVLIFLNNLPYLSFTRILIIGTAAISSYLAVLYILNDKYFRGISNAVFGALKKMLIKSSKNIKGL